jgi:DNA-binding transcriptional LysR family regulator
MSHIKRLPSFRHLRVFEAIAECRNFSRGAASVHLSQPAATQAMFNLEKWLQATLFYRNQGGTYLTDEGAIFRSGVRRLFETVEQSLAQDLFDGSHERARLLAPRIKSSHVSVLRAISEFSSLELAANFLGLSRAAVQRIARDLEATLSSTLFERTPRGVSANALGLRVSASFQRACLVIDEAVEDIASKQQHVSTHLFIGAQPLSSTSLLAASINDLLEQHPQTQVRIIEGSYQYLLQELQSGRLDLMFGALKCPKSVDKVTEIPLFQEPYCVAARAGHPLTSKPVVTLRDLAAVDWVLPGPGTQRRAAFEFMFKDHPQQPRSQIDATSVSAQIALLTSSNRLALLTPLELAMDPHMTSLAQIPYDTKAARNPDGLTLRSDWRPNTVQTAFVACLRHRVAMSTLSPSAILPTGGHILERAG